jgi:hypothetical protein
MWYRLGVCLAVNGFTPQEALTAIQEAVTGFGALTPLGVAGKDMVVGLVRTIFNFKNYLKVTKLYYFKRQ